MIKVLFFGPVAERVGQRELSLVYQDNRSAEVIFQQLQHTYPDAFELVCFTALNGEQLTDLSVLVTDNSELVFMSKYSGG